jgi:small subunit ribosomal protein S20
VDHRTNSPQGALFRRAAHSSFLERKTYSVANIKSQIKRIRTNEKANERNKAVKSQLKTVIRSTKAAVAAGDKDKALAALTVATKKLDKAASKGVIHKNQAANRKAAIAKQVSAL